MLKNIKNKMMTSGFAVLAIGIFLLVFTFISAYGFLGQSLSIIASADLAETFGGTLPPLIATCIRVMYLGVMGWTGSLITIRGVTIVTNARDVEKAAAPKKAEVEQKLPPKKEPMPEKLKEELAKPDEKQAEREKTSEPEFLVIPPELLEEEQKQPDQAQPQQK